jgi:hypothetical protein
MTCEKIKNQIKISHFNPLQKLTHQKKCCPFSPYFCGYYVINVQLTYFMTNNVLVLLVHVVSTYCSCMCNCKKGSTKF